MPKAAYIVVHYHELWLKQGNRAFFLHQLRHAIKLALEGISVVRISEPGDRYVIELADYEETQRALDRLSRVLGISHYGVARTIAWKHGEETAKLSEIAEAAWEEICDEKFVTFAVRAKRSEKRFALKSVTIEHEVGGMVYDKLVAAGREASVDLKHPDVTCRIEVTPGPILIYARRLAGPGGLPANTAGRLTCLLSGGFDSAVAAFKMMKRGAHVNFVHFWGGGAEAGESSIHTVRRLVEQLTPWQGSSKLCLVSFEPLQREIVRAVEEKYRILLYRRLMLRIAERIALGWNSKGLVTGDSLGQVASQTLQNLHSVGAIARVPLYRPLIGDDKLDIQNLAMKIGTFAISEEKFHDCCPVFLPKSPALFALPEELDAEEAKYNINELIEHALKNSARERFRFSQGRVERTHVMRKATA